MGERIYPVIIWHLTVLRSKLWMYNPESGDFSGYYEWDTVEDARNYQNSVNHEMLRWIGNTARASGARVRHSKSVIYSNSFAAGFMTRRSVLGSISFRVIPLI